MCNQKQERNRIKMEYSEVKELIDIFEKTDLNDMEVRLGNDCLRLNRGKAPVMPSVTPVSGMQMPVMAPAMAGVLPNTAVETMYGEQAESGSLGAGEKKEAETLTGKESAKKGGKLITAPIVGTFYQSQAPGEKPFVKVGDQIAAGDVVCIIEAMKFMNEVTSDFSGTITEVLAEDGEFVEYGQELFRVE